MSSFARGSSCFVTLDCLCQDQFDCLVGSLISTADSLSFAESVIIFSELVDLHCTHACLYLFVIIVSYLLRCHNALSELNTMQLPHRVMESISK